MKLDIKATGSYGMAYFEEEAVRTNTIGSTVYYCLTDLLNHFNLINSNDLMTMLGGECKVVKMLNNKGNPSPMKAVTTKGMQILWKALESGEGRQKPRKAVNKTADPAVTEYESEDDKYEDDGYKETEEEYQNEQAEENPEPEASNCIKLCPFCNGQAKVYEDGTVYCPNCDKDEFNPTAPDENPEQQAEPDSKDNDPEQQPPQISSCLSEANHGERTGAAAEDEDSEGSQEDFEDEDPPILDQVAHTIVESAKKDAEYFNNLILKNHDPDYKETAVK